MTIFINSLTHACALMWLRGYVITCLCALRAYMFGVLMYLRDLAFPLAYVFMCLACLLSLCPYILP